MAWALKFSLIRYRPIAVSAWLFSVAAVPPSRVVTGDPV